MFVWIFSTMYLSPTWYLGLNYFGVLVIRHDLGVLEIAGEVGVYIHVLRKWQLGHYQLEELVEADRFLLVVGLFLFLAGY